MKANDANNKWLDERIEAYLDGELAGEELAEFERLLEADGNGQHELTWAVKIRDELRATATPACPPHIEQLVMQEIRRENWSGFKSRFQAGLGALFAPNLFLNWRPAIATLTLLIVTTIAVFVVNRNDIQPPNTENITQAEVDQALEEAKWALAYVSKTGRMTGSSVQDALGPILKEQTKE